LRKCFGTIKVVLQYHEPFCVDSICFQIVNYDLSVLSKNGTCESLALKIVKIYTTFNVDQFGQMSLTMKNLKVITC
jgi:hypothetical protein